ncbi:MAG: LacI family DNA-binding transcriptional regulator [Opitutales bacterium]
MVNINTPSPAPRVLLKDVAQRAHVSIMTVSRALRHGDRVSVKVRDRIRRLAARMGYRPDPHLSALVAYRNRRRPPSEQAVVAYLTSDRTRTGYQASTVSRDALLGASERGRELGYRVENIWLPDLTKRRRDPSRVLRARGIRGIILARLPDLRESVSLHWADFSCVAVGYSMQPLLFHTVASHLFHDMCLAFTHAVEHGYRRPALLLSKDLDQRTQHQLRGAFLYCQESLPAGDRLPIGWTSPIVQPGELRSYLHTHRPDVLLSIGPLVEGALRQLGLHPPREVGLIDLCLEERTGPISGVFQDFQTIGRAAMDRLNILLQHGESGLPQKAAVTALYGEWISGRTLRPLKPRR